MTENLDALWIEISKVSSQKLQIILTALLLVAVILVVYLRVRDALERRRNPLRVDNIFGKYNPSARPGDYKETSLVAHRRMSERALEREMRLQILDSGARERLVADAQKRRNLSRAGAMRLVLEELEAEHRRYP